MPYKTFSGTTLPAADIKSYLMDQAVIACTSSTHPSNPPKGMVIYEADTNQYLYCSNATGPVWTRFNNTLYYSTSNSSVATSAGVYIKDGGCGDIAFSVTSSSTLYRFCYIARAMTDTGGATIDYRINDGGTTTPTNASPTIAAASIYLAASGFGNTQLVVQGIGTLSVGVHTIAAFYGRSAGSGNIQVSQDTGAVRILSVEALT